MHLQSVHTKAKHFFCYRSPDLTPIWWDFSIQIIKVNARHTDFLKEMPKCRTSQFRIIYILEDTARNKISDFGSDKFGLELKTDNNSNRVYWKISSTFWFCWANNIPGIAFGGYFRFVWFLLDWTRMFNLFSFSLSGFVFFLAESTSHTEFRILEGSHLGHLKVRPKAWNAFFLVRRSDLLICPVWPEILWEHCWIIISKKECMKKSELVRLIFFWHSCTEL